MDDDNTRLAEKTADLQTYHPDVCAYETGYDILFFWVIRMIELEAYSIPGQMLSRWPTGSCATARAAKISKSLGNNIDPLDMAAKYA